MYQKTIRAAAVFAALALLSACGAKPEPTGQEGNQVQDQLGRTVTLPENIDKVAATHIYGGKMLFAMGQKDKIAYQLPLGADTEALAKVDPEYGALDTIASSPNGDDSPESLLAYGVDVVFTDAAQGMEEVELFENAGITAIAVSGESFDEVLETTRLMGQVFDDAQRAEDLEAFLTEKRDRILDQTAKLDDSERPVVLISGSGGLLTAATNQMFQHEMIEQAGGINAAAELDAARWAKISAEDLIAWDPDYIILGSSFGTEDVEEVLADPALQTVSAIEKKQVYIFPSNLGWWDFPLPQSLLGITWLATILHPELFPDVDILAEADEVYEWIYGYTYTELGGVITEASLLAS